MDGRSGEVGHSRGSTYNVNTLVPGNTDLGALGTEINTDNAHCKKKMGGITEGEWMGGRLKKGGSKKGREVRRGEFARHSTIIAAG
jgi:hypothetical protein